MRHLLIVLYASLNELFRKAVMLNNTSMKLIFAPGFNKLRAFNAKARAYAEFSKAKKRVPAYNQFLKARGFTKISFNSMVPNLHEIPVTDKENYVNRFSMDERCIRGRVPTRGVVIDESSGSSGTATNWARGKAERKTNARFIRFGLQNLLGKEPLFIINAFALGPWATGVNITMSCVPFSKLKSLGPDKIKIENTLRHFGTSHTYVIMGYPPFLKLLVDTSDICWKQYNITFIFGGESMSEGMRDYLMEKGIKRIYSSLGASDVELNIAAENDFTISLRRLLKNNMALQQKLVRFTGALPMIFQFNPADFLFESSDMGELIITVCRTGYIAPKIRYNLHDRGHVLQLKDVYALLKEMNIDVKGLVPPRTDLPVLLHYGRADMTVSFFGSNIAPNDIQETLYHLPALVSIVHSFCIAVAEDVTGNKQLIVSLELQKSKCASIINIELMQAAFFHQLSAVNQDYREAQKMFTNDRQAVIQFFEFSTGPFESNDIRIKAKYIV
jgi:phenylacetate-CoA ligase